MVRGAWCATVQGITKSWTQLKQLSPAQRKISKVILVGGEPSPTQWTWVWANSRSWWWTGRPGVLRFMRSQRVRHDWVTELNWTETCLWGSFILTGVTWCGRAAGFPGGSAVKNLPAMQQTQETLHARCWEDLLEKAMAIHSSILAWEIPWTEESGGLQSVGSHRVGHD